MSERHQLRVQCTVPFDVLRVINAADHDNNLLRRLPNKSTRGDRGNDQTYHGRDPFLEIHNNSETNK